MIVLKVIYMSFNLENGATLSCFCSFALKIYGIFWTEQKKKSKNLLQTGGDTNLGLSREVFLEPSLAKRNHLRLMREKCLVRTIKRIFTTWFRYVCLSSL